MRRVLPLLPVLFLHLAPAQADPAAPTPAIAARLSAAGAPDLALREAREGLKRGDTDPAWLDVAWTAAGAGASPASGLPPPGPLNSAEAWGAYALAQARADLAQGKRAEARDGLVRLLWQGQVTPEHRREARRLIVESWFDQPDAPLNPLWLRLVQDHPELRPDTEAVALRLAQSGQARQALRLLEGVGMEGPAAILARYRLNEIDAIEAEGQLRKLLAARRDAPVWQSLQVLAEGRKDAALEVEAQERLLALNATSTGPEALWQAYRAQADAAANARQLLTGADAAWLAEAQAIDTQDSRALAAWLARWATQPEVRERAALLLVERLAAAGLGPVAPRLFAALPVPSEPLRYRLGALAAEAGDHPQAMRFWEGVEIVPEGLDPQAWAMRRIEAALGAGQAKAAAGQFERLLDGPAMDAKRGARALAALDALFLAGGAPSVEALAERLLPLLEPAQQRGLWRLRAEMAEARGDLIAAARRQLLAATWQDVQARDPLAIEARQRAARLLQRAGLVADAERQRQWLQGGHASIKP